MEFKTELLDILKSDAKLTNKEIASMMAADEAEVARVREELEADGTILRYAALLNTEKMHDAYAEAFVELQVTPQRDLGYNEIAKRVYMFPEVKEVFLMSGRYDLSVRVEAPTMKAISQFVFSKLAVLDGISGTETLFIMRKYKEHGEILVEEERDERLVVSP